MQCWFYFKAHKCASVPAPANGNVKFSCSFSYSRDMSGTSCAYRSVQRWRESILKYSTFWCRLEPDPWYLNFLYVWIIHVIHLLVRFFCNVQKASVSSYTQQNKEAEYRQHWLGLRGSQLLWILLSSVNISTEQRQRHLITQHKTTLNPAGFVLTSEEPFRYNSITSLRVWGHGLSKPALDQSNFIK